MRWIKVEVDKATVLDGTDKKLVPIVTLSGHTHRPNYKLRNESVDITLRLYTDWIDGNVLPYNPG